MIKYFYLVKFEYFVRDDYKSYFNLGVFSNQRLAKKKVNMSTGLVGFNRYNIDNFKIIKFGFMFISLKWAKVVVIHIFINIFLHMCIVYQKKIRSEERRVRERV